MKISVLIPAHNEEMGVAASVRVGIYDRSVRIEGWPEVY